MNLRRERLLVYDDSFGRLPVFEWLVERGLAHAIAYRNNSPRALLTMAGVGAGVATLPAILVACAGLFATDLALPSWTPWLVTHADLHRQPELKLVRRWIVETFAGAVF